MALKKENLKTVVITGGATGIGLETAKVLVHAEKYRFPSQKKIRAKEYPSPYFGEELTLKPEQAAITVDVPLDPK